VGLKEYGRKRDFSKTPEPAPAPPAQDTGDLFVVQKHAATNPTTTCACRSATC
jgi:hypothetical protein